MVPRTSSSCKEAFIKEDLWQRKNKAFVEHITPRDEKLFSVVYDVVTQADLMDYTPVRGYVTKALRLPHWDLFRRLTGV